MENDPVRGMYDKKRDFLQSLDLRRMPNCVIFPKETIIAMLEEVFDDLRIDGRIVKKIFESIGENLYQGGGQKPQLFYWLRNLKDLLKQARLDENSIVEIIKSLESLIKELKTIK